MGEDSDDGSEPYLPSPESVNLQDGTRRVKAHDIGSDWENDEEDKRYLRRKAKGKRPVAIDGNATPARSPSPADTITDLRRSLSANVVKKEKPLLIGAPSYVDGSKLKARSGPTDAKMDSDEDPCGWLCACCLPSIFDGEGGERQALQPQNPAETVAEGYRGYGSSAGTVPSIDKTRMPYEPSAMPPSFHSSSILPRGPFDF